MRIGYVSYEHPMGMASGGIGTYIGQIARLMANRGEEIEVFTAHQEFTKTVLHDGYLLHCVKSSSIGDFRRHVITIFSERHLAAPFDLIEAAEYGAEALLLKKKFPSLPLAVKLHTPSYLTQLLNGERIEFADKARFYLGGFLRGRIAQPYWIYRKEEDLEYQQYCLADAVCSPSKSLSLLVKEKWPTNKAIALVPNPFVADETFLNILPAQAVDEKLVVGFFGRLEKRKGILLLLKAIPLILQKNPRVLFKFIGKAHPSPVAGMDMEAYLRKELKQWKSHLQFLGFQSYEQMPRLLSETDVCIFPSLWENFPNVCLEAMAAGRAVIASGNGGMAEMINDGKEGLLINPNEPQSIADAVLKLAANRSLVQALGSAARKRVLAAYNETVIGETTSNFYKETIRKSSAATA